MTKHTENKTIDWRERFREKFPLGGEVWVLERHFNEVEKFFQQELDLVLKQRTESLIEATEYVITDMLCNNNLINGITAVDLARKTTEKLKSKYLKQEEK